MDKIIIHKIRTEKSFSKILVVIIMTLLLVMHKKIQIQSFEIRNPNLIKIKTRIYNKCWISDTKIPNSSVYIKL